MATYNPLYDKYHSDLFYMERPRKLLRLNDYDYEGATLLSGGRIMFHIDLIKHIQRRFKERYYAPGGHYETMMIRAWKTKASDYDLNEMEEGEII